jgi:hypothetical protein
MFFNPWKNRGLLQTRNDLSSRLETTNQSNRLPPKGWETQSTTNPCLKVVQVPIQRIVRHEDDDGELVDEECVMKLSEILNLQSNKDFNKESLLPLRDIILNSDQHDDRV